MPTSLQAIAQVPSAVSKGSMGGTLARRGDVPAAGSGAG